MKLGKAIRTIRLKMGLTQDEVCSRASITQGFYSAIENGSNPPSIETLKRICDAFDIPLILIIWRATDRNELSKKERAWYDNLNPVIDAIIDETITS